MPTVDLSQAISMLREQIEKLEDIANLPHWDPRQREWELTTQTILEGVFGRQNLGIDARIRDVLFPETGEVRLWGMKEDDWQRHHVLVQTKRRVLLEQYIRRLEILASPSNKFHPEIERVSGKLYRDGHYKQAALEAYIRVIQAVKDKSHIPDDGDSLMNRAFSFDEGRLPVIQINSLQSEEEKDEQRGFMFLYKGLVGLRNFKAHTNRLFDDPFRAHEYLALASLFMRVLDISTVTF